MTRSHMHFRNCTRSFMKKKVALQHSHVIRDSHLHHHKETGTQGDLLLDNISLDLIYHVMDNLKEKVHEDSHDEHTTLTRYPKTMMTKMEELKSRMDESLEIEEGARKWRIARANCRWQGWRAGG